MYQEADSQEQPKGFFITPVQAFLAFASYKATQEALPKTQGYHEKRWRLISGLFGIPFDLGEEKTGPSHGPLGLLLDIMRLQRRTYGLVPKSHDKGGGEPIVKNVIEAHRSSLRRKEEALSHEYSQMGGELLEAMYPIISEKNVSASRLHELGLPAEAPNPRQEEAEWLDEHWDDLEVEEANQVVPKDDVTPREMDKLKLSEEHHLRTERRIAHEMGQIRLRVMDQGLATQENVDQIIYDMPVAQYLDLAGDFPKISRVHFNPALMPQI